MQTINREFLLTPGMDVNSVILGVLAWAQSKTGVHIHAFTFMSTHFHLIITVRNVEQKSEFMRLLNGNLSKKLNFIHNRRGTMWHRRFRAIGIAPDEATQRSRLRYVMAHGVKEDLVDKVGDWPGASSLPWLLHGKPIYGVWTNFTARYNAMRRKSYVPRPGDFETIYEVRMTVMPCWSERSVHEWRETVCEMSAEIDATAKKRRRLEGVRVLGKKAVLAAKPTKRLPPRKRTPAPAVHCVDAAAHELLVAGLRLIRDAYDEASQRFRAGEWDVRFPEGMFRPSGGFVVPTSVRMLDMW
ncbi:MAG: transposase [Myxococcales bacterium]|nr:transposase [Myxococcales bacterium]